LCPAVAAKVGLRGLARNFTKHALSEVIPGPLVPAIPGLEDVPPEQLEAVKKAGLLCKEVGVRIEIVGIDPPALSAVGGLK
jgi:hypothetical protein